MTTDAPRTLRLLIVEDHEATLALIERLLVAAFPGCAVTGVVRAEEALACFADRAPDVVVMDVSLPGMNGIEATQRISAIAPATRIVVHSGHDIPVFRDAAARAGAHAFVSKERTFQDLVPAIQGALAAAGRGSA